MSFSTILTQKQPITASNPDVILTRTLSAILPENAKLHAQCEVLIPVPRAKS